MWQDICRSVEHALGDRTIRSEIALETAPAPAKLATHTSAILADVDVDGQEVGSGRLVILYEPDFQTTWDGHIRCVAFVRAELEQNMVTDPLLLEVGWSWTTDALANRGATPIAISGTVSRNGSQSFGDLSDRRMEGSIEIRVSWTVANGDDIAPHVLAWCDMLAHVSGLPTLTDGVVSITRQLGRL